jgi:hypothetical protein
MNTRKIFSNTIFLAMTVLVTLSLSWHPAGAKSGVYHLDEGETIELGRQGLHATNIPLGVSSAFLDMVGNELPAWFNRNVEVSYRLPAMEVRFLNADGEIVEDVSALVYVFFNISKAEKNLWFQGGMEKIAIWYVDPLSRTWELCPTFFANNTADDGTSGRLTCLAKGSGYYIVGAGDFKDELSNLYDTEEAISLVGQPIPQ